MDLLDRRRMFMVLLTAAFLWLGIGDSAVAAGRTLGSETGLPIPRYVTLRSNEVNLRTGPGVRYPVDWVMQRRHMPVEIVAEFDTWRKVRDPEGTEGWVHQSMLSGRRAVLVLGSLRTLRRSPSDTAPAIARVEAGVVAWLEGCRPEWCEIEAEGLSGWIHRAHVWGVRIDEGRKR